MSMEQAQVTRILGYLCALTLLASYAAGVPNSQVRIDPTLPLDSDILKGIANSTTQSASINVSYEYRWYKDGILNRSFVYDPAWWWPFDTSTTYLTNNKTMEIVNLGMNNISNVSLKNGKYDKAISIGNGSSVLKDVLFLNNSNVLFQNNNSWTIAFWLNFTTKPTGTSYLFYAFSDSAFSDSFDLSLSSSQGISASLEPTSGLGETIQFLNLMNNTWYFIAITYNGSRAKMYFNGTSEISDAFTFLGFGSSKAILGSNRFGGNAYNGLIDDLMIFNTSLSDDQVMNIYNGSFKANYLQSEVNLANISAAETHDLENWTFSVRPYSNYTFGNWTNSSARMIYSFGLDNCSTYNMTTMNITFRDYSTDSNVIVNASVSVDYSAGSLSDLNYSISRIDISNTTFCINPNVNFTAEFTIQYSKDTTTYNYFIDGIFNNLTQQLILYTQSDTIAGLLAVYDQNTDPIEDAEIKMLRYDIGTHTFKTTEILKTDSNGKAIGNAIMNIVYYRFIIEKNNSVLITEDSSLIVATSSCTFTWCKNFYTALGESTWFDNAVVVEGVETSLYFNNLTNNFVYNFNDPSNEMHQACLRVDVYNKTGQYILSDECTTSTAGSILYHITAKNDSRFTGTGYLHFDEDIITDIVEKIFESVEKFWDFTGMIFYAFILALLFIMMGVWHPELAHAGLALSSIISYFAGFWHISVMMLGSIITLGIINYYVTRPR